VNDLYSDHYPAPEQLTDDELRQRVDDLMSDMDAPDDILTDKATVSVLLADAMGDTEYRAWALYMAHVLRDADDATVLKLMEDAPVAFGGARRAALGREALTEMLTGRAMERYSEYVENLNHMRQGITNGRPRPCSTTGGQAFRLLAELHGSTAAEEMMNRKAPAYTRMVAAWRATWDKTEGRGQ